MLLVLGRMVRASLRNFRHERYESEKRYEGEYFDRLIEETLGNSPKNPKVQEAYRLLNSIKGGKDDDDDF